MSTINFGISLADLQPAMFFATEQYTRGAEPIDPSGAGVTIPPPSDPSAEGAQAPSSGAAGAEAQQGIPADDAVMSFMALRA